MYPYKVGISVSCVSAEHLQTRRLYIIAHLTFPPPQKKKKKQSDTVAEALARKLKVSKAELLSRDADRYEWVRRSLSMGAQSKV